MQSNGVPAAHENRLWETSTELVHPKRPGDFNQAMMELGATVCLPKKPLCLICPLQKSCEAQLRGEVDKFPAPRARARTQKIEVSAAVITRGGKVYIQQRLHGGLMATSSGCCRACSSCRVTASPPPMKTGCGRPQPNWYIPNVRAISIRP